jgi:hypothetical protein
LNGVFENHAQCATRLAAYYPPLGTEKKGTVGRSQTLRLGWLSGERSVAVNRIPHYNQPIAI